YFDNDGGPGREAVWILFLNTDGTVKGYQKISDTQGSFYGSLVDWEVFGYDIASLGDLDGDGVTEIAVGAVGNNDGGPKRGGLWILHLRANGQVKSYQRINDLYGNFQGELEDDVWFGSSVESLGDLDGDGIVDIAVGSCLDNDGGLYRSGAVWILFLNVNGTVKSHQKISASQGGFSGILDERDEFGISIACMGDMDNDGIVDISVGAKADDDGGVDRGAVWLLFLNSDGTVKAFKKISNTQGGFDGVLDDSDRFGHACEYVRIQGNGKKAGLVVSSIRDDDGGDDRGAVWVMQLDVVRAPYLYVGAGPNSGIDLSASFDTIQEAIDSAETGDTILVYPGVYNESIDFGGKAITVKSALEPATIKEELVSALGGVVFANNETADSVLSNFIIEGHFNGIYCINSSPTIRNVTIVNNNYGIVALGDSTPTITSSIIWENNTAALLGCEAVYSCFPVGDGINGNIHENPQFADFSAGDYRLLSQAGRFDSGMSKWVLDDITSPCIDAGSPIANPMSEPMPNGGRVNIGAYGGSIQASRSPNQWPNAADVNRDGRVDLLDIALVAQNWLWTAPWVE
ncbi:MAG: hypothetical protein K9M57_02055, partial [Phycisphaerae bacterium]|nr:hypothetical protein [Phycisphaerae bacterium]